MNLQNVHSKAMSLQQALEFSRTLAKNNPFVRMTQEEQELANQAGTLISRMANTEELEFLLKDEKMKVRNFVANAEKDLFWKIIMNNFIQNASRFDIRICNS